MKYIHSILVLFFLLVTSTVHGQAISGTLSLCTGSSVTLSGTPAGGVWSSSNIALAPVSGGTVLGTATGTAIISYATGSGTATATVTVNPQPGPITGATTICSGSATVLNAGMPGGTWTSGAPAVLAINTTTGAATGIALGTAVVTYTTGAGCSTYTTVTVQPAVAAITGPSVVCSGGSITLANSTAGGTWSSNNTSIAVVGAVSGIVSGITSGTTHISYTVSAGCYATRITTVDLSVAPITGPPTVCAGSIITLANSTPGGTWSSSSPAIATISSAGIVAGMAPGVVNIVYTTASGCATFLSLTVQAVPSAIAGVPNICLGSTVTFSNSVAGGTWSSSNASVAGAGTFSGIVSGNSVGTAAISYTLGSSPGCFVTYPVTVSIGPSAISGPSSVCTGSTITLTTSPSGGTWSSSSSSIATVSAASGIVSGNSAGNATITYATSASGCQVTKQITVNPVPAPITGSTSLCTGLSTSLASATTGGIWSSSMPAVASLLTTSGYVTAIAPGTTIIAYTLPTGCSANVTVTVDPAPGAIAGPGSVCQGALIVLTNPVAGGTWSTGDATIASVVTVGAPGSILGIAPGVATITYMMPSGCMATATIVVHPQPLVVATAALSACGPAYLGVATGGDSYVWAPTMGLSCPSCATTLIDTNVTATYTITATNLIGCVNSTTLTVNGNRILGHVTFSGATPSPADVGVWLMRYNAADSSLVAVDSTTTCLDGGVPYFEFPVKPAGDYHLRAKHLSALPGYSGYVPTYQSATPHWWQAAGLHHGTATDTAQVVLQYANTPAGAGVIRGVIRTDSSPVYNMLVLLKDAGTGQVVCHTYTDGTGRYIFSGIAYGSYFVYPEEYHYYTTTGSALTVSSTHALDTMGFKKDSAARRIYPYSYPVAVNSYHATQLALYPNPASQTVFVQLPAAGIEATMVVRDVAGREVYSARWISTSATQKVLLPDLANGIYTVQLHTGDTVTNTRLHIQH